MVRKSYSVLSTSQTDDPANGMEPAYANSRPGSVAIESTRLPSNDALRFSHLDTAAKERDSHRGSNGGPSPPKWMPPPPPRDGSGDYV